MSIDMKLPKIGDLLVPKYVYYNMAYIVIDVFYEGSLLILKLLSSQGIVGAVWSNHNNKDWCIARISS